jgi:Na+/H+ antiporter NhaD/arsenite permease-like protein
MPCRDSLGGRPPHAREILMHDRCRRTTLRLGGSCRPARFLSGPLRIAGVAALAALLPGVAQASSGEHGSLPPLWMTTFFVVMLLCIAILPLTPLEHWWHSNRNKLILGLVLAAYPLTWVVFLEPDLHALFETVEEYISFIILLGTLFYVSGGILLTGDLRATPQTNLKFLAFGTLIASFVGTTGASMLLIRPVLRTNQQRRYKVHTVIFFIFLVSNIGGSLLPIGDPPLFLGYLQGVPFLWTLGLWRHMALVSVLLLGGYFLLDRHFYGRESKADLAADDAEVEPLRVEGKINLVWLLGIVLCVALILPEHGLFVREAAMIACAVASRFTTPQGTRARNEFSWFPILEVAALFIGIFLTMIPTLMLLKAQGGQLGVDTPIRFFWVTGVLSSFLDNAPTYLVFFNTAQGMVEQGMLTGEMVEVAKGSIPVVVLEAISVGAVFMGANTYIGNGPNFMVKAIAEEQKVEMPGFFGYMRWSFLVLIPTFVLVTLIFF